MEMFEYGIWEEQMGRQAELSLGRGQISETMTMIRRRLILLLLWSNARDVLAGESSDKSAEMLLLLL